MHRSTGVTVSAAVATAGSAFTILGGAMMLVGSAFTSKSSSAAANLPVDVGSILIVEAVLVFGFGGWGLSTGIGLIYLKQWARISLLIYAGILVCLSLPAAALMFVVPFPNTNDPNLPSNFASVMRVGMGIFYGAFAALGGFWLYFFNKRTVKVQFQAMSRVPESAAGDSFLGAATPVSNQPARPLSITIIGWFLLISSPLAPLGLLANRTLFSNMQLTFYFLGFFFFGPSAYLMFLLWMAVQVAAAAGLLKLKRWALFATIGLQSLAFLNGTLLLGIPGHRARFQQIMETAMASMNARVPQPVPFNFPVWLGLAMSFPIVVLLLWFLITRRQAFSSAAQGPAHNAPNGRAGFAAKRNANAREKSTDSDHSA